MQGYSQDGFHRALPVSPVQREGKWAMEKVKECGWVLVLEVDDTLFPPIRE